jgi:hypothetical protein
MATQNEIEGHSINRVPTDDEEDAPEPSNDTPSPRPKPRPRPVVEPTDDVETSVVDDE